MNTIELPEIRIVESSETETQIHWMPAEEQEYPQHPSCLVESSRLVKRPKFSHITSGEPTQSIVGPLGINIRKTATSVEHDSTENSFLDSEPTDVSCYSGYTEDSFDPATDDTSLGNEGEEGHPQPGPLYTGPGIDREDALNLKWDLAQIGTFVDGDDDDDDDDEELNEALLAASGEVLDIVAARLEGILKEAEDVLSKFKWALESIEDRGV